MVNKPTKAIGFLLILAILFVFESSSCAIFTLDRELPTSSDFPLEDAFGPSRRRFAPSLREAPFQPISLWNRHNSVFSFCPSFHQNAATHGVATANGSAAGTEGKRPALATVYSAVQEADRKGASGAHRVVGPVTYAPGGGEADLRWDTVPITKLRTAARNLQLSTKGTRVEIRKRLEESVSTEKMLAVLRSIEGPNRAPETHEGRKKASKIISDAAQTPKAMRCHVCNSRLSATEVLIRHSILRELYCLLHGQLSLLVAHFREQEVGSNTMRVEKGFWQSILQVRALQDPVTTSGFAVPSPLLRCFAAAWVTLTGWHRRASFMRSGHRRCSSGRSVCSGLGGVLTVYLLLAATPNTMHCALFAVGIGAGLRPSELLSMRWEDVNMEEMTATIRGSKTAASAAAIPLTNLAGRELMRW
ncbi:hypothetical protein Emag_005844 [Eimeria magna]